MSFTSRPLSIAIAAKAVSLLGNGLADIALVLRLQPLGAGPVAGVLACNLLPIVVLSGIAGRLVDTVSPRRLLVSSGLALAVISLPLVRLHDPSAIFVFVALLGAGQAINAATWQAVIPALAPPGRLAWALSRSQVGTTLAAVAAPALGGVLVAASGTGGPLLVDALTFVLLAVAGLALGRVHVAADRDDRSGGLAIIARSPILRATVGVLTAAVLLGCTVNVAEVFLVRSTLRSGPLAFGISEAAYAVGALVGALGAGRFARVEQQARVLLGGVVLLGVGLAVMGLSPDITWLIAAGVLTGVLNGVVNVCSAALVFGATPAGQRGRVGAMQNGILSAAQLVAYGAAAGLAAVVGPRAIFVLGGLLAALTPLVIGRSLRRAAGLTPAHRISTVVPVGAADATVSAAVRALGRVHPFTLR